MTKEKNNERKIAIWGDQIPFNTGESKKEAFLISKKPAPVAMLLAFRYIFGKKIMKSREYYDTYSLNNWISKGNESMYFDDVPTLTPYLRPGSDRAIIIAPGGAFVYKEMEREGYHNGELLSSLGFNAFVLDYRLNPYRSLAGCLDMQRAVRYLRAHASEYGIDPHKIGVLGCSAGGYIAGSTGTILNDEPPCVEGYVPDEVDAVSGRPDYMALLYPVTGFLKNPSMLAMIAGDDFFDPGKQKKLQEEYSLRNHLDGDVPPQFICYGDKDLLKDMCDYSAAVKAKGLPLKEIIIKNATHGLTPISSAEKTWSEAFKTWTDEILK